MIPLLVLIFEAQSQNLRDALRIAEILFCTETAKYIQFREQHCQKYASNQKKLQIKIAWNWIFYKKSASTYVYPLPSQCS